MTNTNQKRITLGSGKLLRIQRKRDAIEVFGIFAVLAPVLAFLINGGLIGVENLADWFNVFNRLTALVGTSLLLVHMILIARVPWLEKTFGLDKTTVAHKKLGKPLLYVLVLHFFTALISYSMADGVTVLETLVSLLTSYQDILLATIALLLFVVVTVTSIRIARRKLSYEAWYLVHLTSYLAVMIAIPHQFNLGSDFLAEPIVAGYFAALYIFVFANIVWFRFITPILFSLRSRLRVVKVVPDQNRTTSIYVGGERVERMGAEAGQFFMFRVLTPSQWWRPHPFSVSANPNTHTIRFTIGNRGDDTSKLQQIRVGTRVMLEGPYGIFSESKRTRQKVTLMAAGIGVAPVRALAESLTATPGDVTVIYRVNTNNNAALLPELVEICEARGHNLRIVEGERSKNLTWLPDAENGSENQAEHARLLSMATDIVDSDVYICGPSGWSNAVVANLKKLGIQKEQIHVEEFAW
jgi:predicted ferric reductase